MSDTNTSVRTLSLDVRSAKFGFVVFEEPDQLADYGVRSYACGHGPLNTVLRRSFRKLINLYFPSLIVFRIPPNRADNRTRRAKVAAGILRKESKRQSIPIRCISRGTIKRFFRAQGLTNKYRIASYLADRFPNLAWKLPPRRRLWQSERHRMSIFDAVAAGVVCLQRPGVEVGSQIVRSD